MSKFNTIPGFSKYEASKDGEIRHRINKVIRKPRKDRPGYLAYSVYDDESESWKMVFGHRLVYAAFNGKIPDNTYIDHINRVRSDNSIGNLRAVTRLVNNNNKKQIVSPVSLRRIEHIIELHNQGVGPEAIHEMLKKRPI